MFKLFRIVSHNKHSIFIAVTLPVTISDAIFYVNQRSLPPRPWTSTGPWPIRYWAAEQEVSSGQESKASLNLLLELHLLSPTPTSIPTGP